MRKALIVLVSVLSVFTTACGESEPELSETDQRYVDIVRDELPNLDHKPDETLILWAESSCDNLNRGWTYENIVETTYGMGLNQSEGIVLASAAIGAYCPEVLYNGSIG